MIDPDGLTLYSDRQYMILLVRNTDPLPNLKKAITNLEST